MAKEKALNPKHEAFSIDDMSKAVRKKMIRQDRLDASEKECFVELFGKRFKVVDFSSFGLALESDTSLEQDNFINVPFIYENSEIGSVNITKVREEAAEGGGLKTAFEILGEPIHIECIEAINAAHQVIAEHEQFIAHYSDVPAEFRALVLEAKNWLENIKSRVDEIERNTEFTSKQEKADYEGAICEVLGDYFKQSFGQFYALFGPILDNMDEEGLKLCHSYFREKLNQLLHGSIFAERSFAKPLGYAGDYEMMNIIYRSENYGETLFAKALQKYFVDEPSAKAVKNRAHYLSTNLKQQILARKDQQVIRFLSVASGPAKEVQLILEDPELKDIIPKVEFHFIDQDLGSLKHAQRKLLELQRRFNHSCKFEFHNLAIKNIIARGIPEKDFDMIYSAGLFDYFTDPVARVSGERFVASLKKDGIAIIGNFGLNNPNYYAMTMALDWHLKYRSENDMLELFSGLGSDITLEKEDEGVNLFAKIIK